MKRSAGLLLYRRVASGLEVLLVHPGGPFWAKKDAGAWSVPKGEYESGQDALGAARREFEEETGFQASGQFIPLGEHRQAGGKIVTVWALEQNVDPRAIRSNMFELEWPPRSGKLREFPEVDRAAWFSLEEAAVKLLPSQTEFLSRLATEARAS
jgi:predicted NUDIX family NTP pyrophosphohydrolase